MNFRNLEFGKTMESMDGEKLKERIKLGMDFEIPHKIRPIPYLGEQEQICEYAFDELVARCPVTGIKDHYKIIIRYIPDKFIPELKSLKFYFWDYEEEFVPISHEHLASKIYSHFKEVIQPKDLFIRLDVAGRGVIFTTIRLGNMEFDKLSERNFKNL